MFTKYPQINIFFMVLEDLLEQFLLVTNQKYLFLSGIRILIASLGGGDGLWLWWWSPTTVYYIPIIMQLCINMYIYLELKYKF